MMNYLDQILESWLPSKWSRLIAGLTIVTAGASIALPEFLQKLDIQLSKGNIVLIRIAVPLLILWLGTLIVLLIVVQHSGKPTSEFKNRIYELEHQITTLNTAHLEEISALKKAHSQEIAQLTEKYNKAISEMRHGKDDPGWGAFT